VTCGCDACHVVYTNKEGFVASVTKFGIAAMGGTGGNKNRFLFNVLGDYCHEQE
jgi:hypothetical protein